MEKKLSTGKILSVINTFWIELLIGLKVVLTSILSLSFELCMRIYRELKMN